MRVKQPTPEYRASGLKLSLFDLYPTSFTVNRAKCRPEADSLEATEFHILTLHRVALEIGMYLLTGIARLFRSLDRL
jgi:hypothetical protein